MPHIWCGELELHYSYKATITNKYAVVSKDSIPYLRTIKVLQVYNKAVRHIMPTNICM